MSKPRELEEPLSLTANNLEGETLTVSPSPEEANSITESPEPENQTIPEEHEIDKAYSKEMKNWTGNIGEGIEIQNRYTELWKEEMNKYHKLLYEELNEDKKELLVSSQEKWEEFFIADELLEMEVNLRVFRKGSMRRELNALIPLYKYRDRALDLRSFYRRVYDVRDIPEDSV